MRSLKHLVLPLTLIFLVFCGGSPGPRGSEGETGVKFRVKTRRVQYRMVQKTLRHTGTVEAYRKRSIVPRINGRIKRILVEEGQIVSRGQVLVELDRQQAEIQLRQAQAGLEAARVNFEEARRNFLRAQKLLEERAISRQRYEKAEMAFKAAGARLKQARASVEMARFLLDSSRLRAPFSGVITRKLKEEGDFVNPAMAGFGGGPGILVLMNFERIKVYVDVPSSEIALVKPGAPSLIRRGKFTLQGKVFSVAQAADPASRTFRVGVLAENKDLLLKPGTDVEVSIVIARRKALAVPLASLVEGKYIFVVEGETAHRKEVLTGLKGDQFVEIRQGLREGERIVVEGLFGLYDGARVEEVK